MRIQSSARQWVRATMVGALAAAGAAVGCASAAAPGEADDVSEAAAHGEVLGAQALPQGYWWTCTARARIAPGFWANYTGIGPNRSAAEANTLAQCAGEGCYITGCHPGL
jgi:hypothetical protein